MWQRNEHEETRRRSSRIADECVGGAAARVVSGKQRLMVGHPATSGAPVEHDQGPDDASHPPSALSRDARREPHLGIKPAERILHIPDAGLALGHLQDAGWPMERQLVDPAALAVDAVAGLDPHVPTSPPVAIGPRLDDARMVRVEEAIEVSTSAPGDVKKGSRVESAEDATDRPKGIALGPAAFHIGDGGWAHIASGGKVPLSPPSSLTQDEDHTTDALIVHSRMVRREPLSGDYAGISVAREQSRSA